MQLDIKTVRRILRQKKPQAYVRARQESKLLKPFVDYILGRLAAVGYCAQAIYEELRGRGYTGSYDVVKRFISPLHKELNLEATIRFETPPGRQGQAGWGQCWTTIGGKKTKAHLFVLTLGYSRRMYAAATADEKMPAFLRSHEEAFDFLGGVPHEIVYDNLKSVVLGPGLRGLAVRVEPGLLGLQPLLWLQTSSPSALSAPDQGEGRERDQVRQAVPAGENVPKP